MRPTTRTSAVAAGLLLVGCGQGTVGSATPAARSLECGGSAFDADALDGAPPASSLPAGPAGAVDDMGAPAFDPTLGWSVVSESDARVDLLRPLAEPFDNGGGDVRTHESVVLERIEGAGDVTDGTWMLTSAGPCAPRLVPADGHGPADVTLAAKPGPSARTLDLLVRERECASGQSADGRTVVALEETPSQVRVSVEVRLAGGGAQTCQGNPATPVTVELADPLGEREVVDSSVLPARPLVVDAGEG